MQRPVTLGSCFLKPESLRWRIAILFIVVLVVVVLPVLVRKASDRGNAEVSISGSFTQGGEYPTTRMMTPFNARTWASWAGDDNNTGSISIGSFVAEDSLRIAYSGYPNREGISLHLKMMDLPFDWALPAEDAGEQWKVQEFEIPFGFRGRRVLLVAVDNAHGIGGWVGVSEPLPVPGAPLQSGFSSLLAAFFTSALLYLTMAWSVAQILGSRPQVHPA